MAPPSFLDAVHLERTALVGNSWSGGWALAFAQRYPNRVSRLALLDSSGLDVPDIWTWRVFKIPCSGNCWPRSRICGGEIAGNLSTRCGPLSDDDQHEGKADR